MTTLFGRMGKLLGIAATPLALTVLLARPASGSAESIDEVAAHHVATNPIENFATPRTGGKTHDGHQPPPPFLAALLNFGVLAFLVGRFAVPSLSRFVRERHDAIAKQLDESARLRDAAAGKLDEYTKKLAALDHDVTRLTAEIRAAAESENKRILADATAKAERMRRDAEQQIKAELQRTRATLEREAVLMAMAAAERIIRERVADADQRMLTNRFVSSLKKETTA